MRRLTLIATVGAMLVGVAGSASAAPRPEPRDTAPRAGNYTVTATVSSSSVDLYERVTMTGTVSPAAPRQAVRLQKRPENGKWTTIATRKLTEQSRFKFTLPTGVAERAAYRVIKPASPSGKRGAGISSRRYLSVYRWLLFTKLAMALEDDYSTGTATMNGTAYVNSIWATDCSMCDGDEEAFRIVTSRRCSTFKGTVGMLDSADVTAHPVVSFYGDGVSYWASALNYGTSVPVVFDISNYLQFEVHLRDESESQEAAPAIGNGQLRCRF